MALLFELLLTAVLTLLGAFLLATFFAANDPRRDPGRAAAIAEEEEERIIEVDEVKLSERRVGAEEGWVEVEKAPAMVVKGEEAEEEPECSPIELDEEGVPLKPARVVRPAAGPGLEEEEEVDVSEKRCDSTAAATGLVVEANPQHVLVTAEAVTRDVPDVLGRLQDVAAKRHDLRAEAAPDKVPVEARHQHLVSEVAPAAEVVDAGTEESSQAIEVWPCELAAAETASGEIPDVVLDKKVEQVVEAKGEESTAETVPQAALDAPLTEKEEVKVQQHIEEAGDTHEEVQKREESKCATCPVNQQEQPVSEEELVAMRTGVVEVRLEGSSSDKVATELPVSLQGLPEDDTGADMDFGEWEGVERSEVETRFGAAAAFASSEAGVAALSKLNSDVQLQLQGLLKVAVDGPCYDSTQPLTLRPSSRARWVAWQKLGNMHPEIAMEKYMNLLSEVIPGGWEMKLRTQRNMKLETIL